MEEFIVEVSSALDEFEQKSQKSTAGETTLVDTTDKSTVDARTLAVIRQMAPIMVMHPDEAEYCCFPYDPAKFFRRQGVIVETRGKGWKLKIAVWNPERQKWREFELGDLKELAPYIQSVRGKLGNDTSLLPHNTANTRLTSGRVKWEYPTTFDANTPCYVEHWPMGDRLQVRYWLWWNYNDHPRDTRRNFGSHEGDWEHVELRLRWLSSTRFRFTYYLSAHNGARNTAGVHWRSTNPKQNPLFFVSLGGHAIYETPGNYGGWFGFGRDSARNSSMKWRTYDHLTLKGDVAKKHSVFGFRGMWGKPGGPPTKPRDRNAPLNRFP